MMVGSVVSVTRLLVVALGALCQVTALPGLPYQTSLQTPGPRHTTTLIPDDGPGRREFEASFCCMYEFGSQDYKDCCKAVRGECPQCKTIHFGAVRYTIDRSCLTSYECCTLPFGHEEFHQCCMRHGCCPPCNTVSRGCCYNDRIYTWGSVVHSFPDCCTDVVCGARLLSTSPYLEASIIPLMYNSNSSDECDPVQNDYCIDEKGIIRLEGDEWYVNSCKVCRCVNGEISCNQVAVCPRPHDLSCQERPGDCCPTWYCPIDRTCEDENGKLHNIGDSWHDINKPCVVFECSLHDGIIESHIDCAPLPNQPHHHCTVIKDVNGCCDVWKCVGCTDDQGREHQVGDSWEDTCTIYLCMEPDNIKTTSKRCPVVDPHPHKWCEAIFGDCRCQTWNCSGCRDEQGIRRKLGEIWRHTTLSCLFNCTDDGIEQICPPHIDQPFVWCVEQEDHCRCKFWNCPGCSDHQGRHRKVGDTWQDPRSPCETSVCTDRGEVKQRRYCSPLGPQPSTRCEVIYDNCGCESWNCTSGVCTDNQGSHEIGETWNDPRKPCVTFLCTEHGIFSIPCPHLGGQPQPWCQPVRDNCGCPTWNCSGCIDSQGRHHGFKETWQDPRDPCKEFLCTERGEVVQVEHCPPLGRRPDYRCQIMTDNCGCQKWSCPVCTDDRGSPRRPGDTWDAPGCQTSVCTETGVINKTRECPLVPQPFKHCKKIWDGCCYIWDCPVMNCQQPCPNFTIPPDPLCELVRDDFQCCPVWKCPEICPVAENWRCESKANCSDHNGCLPPLICCSVGECDQNCPFGDCNKRCVKKGTCPPVPLVQCFRFEQKCLDDEECGVGQKCCSVPCGTACAKVYH